MRKTNNKWRSDICGGCGGIPSIPHENYTGKLDKDNVEYVMCGLSHKKVIVSFDYVNEEFKNKNKELIESFKPHWTKQ